MARRVARAVEGQVELFDTKPLTELLPDELLPAAPLVAWWGGPSAAARGLDVDRRTIYRWMESGLDFEQADTLATRSGLHPERLWPNFNTIGVDDDVDDPLDDEQPEAEEGQP